MTLLLTLIPFGLPGLSAHAEGREGHTALEFDVWMQQIDRHSQGVLRHIDEGDAQQSLADAQALVRLYQDMEEFYEQRGDSDDAVLASYVGKDHARNVARLVSAHDLPAARDEASEISRDCRECHIRFKPLPH